MDIFDTTSTFHRVSLLYRLSLRECSPFLAEEDHAIRAILPWLAIDFILSEGGLCRLPASHLLQNHLNPVTRYSSGWLEMTQDETIRVKWLGQGHTPSECQVSEVRFELRSSWLLHSCSMHCTTSLPHELSRSNQGTAHLYVTLLIYLQYCLRQKDSELFNITQTRNFRRSLFSRFWIFSLLVQLVITLTLYQLPSWVNGPSWNPMVLAIWWWTFLQLHELVHKHYFQRASTFLSRLVNKWKLGVGSLESSSLLYTSYSDALPSCCHENLELDSSC